MSIKNTLRTIALVSAIGLFGCSNIEKITKPEDFEKQVIEEVGNVSKSVESSNALSKSIDVKGIGRFLDVSIQYLNPAAYNEENIPVYLINCPLNYEFSINNNIPAKHNIRPFQNLEITVIKEYGESGTCNRYWYPYPLVVDFTKGQTLPGNSVQVWENINLVPGETKVLTDSYAIPLETCSGLGQTHIIIKQRGEGNSSVERVIYDKSEAGEFYLKAPGRQ